VNNFARHRPRTALSLSLSLSLSLPLSPSLSVPRYFSGSRRAASGMRTRRRRRCRRIDHAGTCTARVLHAYLPLLPLPPHAPMAPASRASRYAAHVALTIPPRNPPRSTSWERLRTNRSGTVSILYLRVFSARLLRRPPYFAGYVRRGKAKSNYIRDTGIPHRARSAGQLKNNRSSSRTGPSLRDLLPFLSLSLIFFPSLFIGGIPRGNVRDTRREIQVRACS